MMACVDDDRGVATVWAAGAIAVLLSLAVFGLHLGEAVVVRHQVESAADLAALAGAGQVLAGEQYACAQARRVTDRMRVRLVSCQTRGWDVLVDLAAQPAGWLGGLGAATGRARAGPTGTAGDYPESSADGSASSTASSTVIAPALSSGSLPLPHLGDCTQEGQPAGHSHAAMASRVAVSQGRSAA
jgi:secretion/DNA translocation related TadE-like protein